MVLSTTQARSAWGNPGACSTAKVSTLEAYKALDACFKAYGYRPRAGVTGAQNCRKITGGTGYSLHAYAFGALFTLWTLVKIAMALAVDINWDRNPYGPRLVTDMPRPMIDAIYRIRTRSGAQVWRWGGLYAGNKDAMHFEIVCTPADLASGIDPRTLPGAAPKPTPVPTPTPRPTPAPPSPTEAHKMNLLIKDKNGAWWNTDGVVKKHETDRQHVRELVLKGLLSWAGFDTPFQGADYDRILAGAVDVAKIKA